MILSEPVLALQRRQQMDREAQELRAWQHTQSLQFARAYRRPRREQEAIIQLQQQERLVASSMPPLKLGQVVSGWPILWAQVEWAGIAHYMSPSYDQLTFSRAGEVIMLPFETLTFLSTWSQITVVPQGINPVHNAGTGLDTFNQDSNAPWGIDSSGQPYFDTEGGNGAGRCFVDGTGQPYLTP